MNLFRVRIEEATGGAAGEPEAVTTSAGSLGWSRFSNDGRRLVAQVYELSTILELYRLTTGPTASVRAFRTLRPRSLQWCSISPDAEWLACSTIGTPEDLVLLRADGSELRRLTDDVFKDRDIAWSPDGSRLQFQSTRSGSWTFWSLRPDGSELRQLIDLGPDRYASIAAWRPDGRGVTFRADDRHLATIDATRLTRRSELQLTPLPSSIASFTASAWSPSGALLGGAETDVTQLALSVGAIDPERAVYVGSRLPAGGEAFRAFGGWLPDSRHFVARGADQIALVDVETGAFQPLLPVGAAPFTFVSLSGDGGTLLVETPNLDGDIWLLESKQEAGVRESSGDR